MNLWWNSSIIFFIDFLLTLFTLIPLLIVIAFFTLAERKIMASIQRRRGPNVVGFWGVLQPIADGFKLIIKEIVLPTKINSMLFIFAPFFTFFTALISWIFIPFSFKDIAADVNLGSIYILAISSFGVYGIFLAGWSSNSKYAFMGSLRAIAQMISYEVVLSVSIMPVILLSGSANFYDIVFMQQKVTWYVFPLFPLCTIFFICILAETNRAPFDLAEAEAELVAGYNLEYSSVVFALFFLGEYSNMILMSALLVIFFFGGWLNFLPFSFFLWVAPEIIFSIKTIFVCFMFILVRSILPRYRYDQLMFLCWKRLMPFTGGYLVFISGTLLAYDGFFFNQSCLFI